MESGDRLVGTLRFAHPTAASHHASNPAIGFTATLSGNTRDASAASSTRT